MSHPNYDETKRRVKKAKKQLESFVLPQSPAELAAMAALGPVGGKLFKGAMLGSGALASDEANAGGLAGLQRLYRGLRYPQINNRGLRLDQMGRPIDEYGNLTADWDKGVIQELESVLPSYTRKKGLYNTPLGATWWTDNPRLAETYTNSNEPFLIPAFLTREPDEVMDAEGKLFSTFFDKDTTSGKDFRHLLRRKNLKSIRVDNIVDPGPGSPRFFDDIRAEYPTGSLNDAFYKVMKANNYLIRDPSVLRLLDRTIAK